MQLTTQRLIIRPFTKEDLPQFLRLLDIPEVEGWRMQKPRAGEFLDWHIHNYEAMDIVNGIVCFGVFDRAGGQVLGAAGAGEHDDLHEPELFYNLLPEARGHGYATEAAAAVTRWALESYPIPYLIATVSADNASSRRVVERCGFTFVERQELLVHITGKRYQFDYFRIDRDSSRR